MGKPNFNIFVPTNTHPDSPAPQGPSDVSTLVKKLNVSKPKSFEVKMIPRKKIRVNKKNDYPIEEAIESLKNSILYFGLSQPLKVIYLISEDLYCIEAGHRRTNAIDSLVQEFINYDGDQNDTRYQYYLRNVKIFESGYPCVIGDSLSEDYDYDMDDSDLSTVPDAIIDSEIRLRITNEEVRNNNPARKAQNVHRLAMLYERKI